MLPPPTMPLSGGDRVEKLVTGIEDAGCAVRQGFEPNDRPFRLVIDSKPYRVFLWRITPGGRTRSEEEYRVQTTRPGDTPLFDPDQRTLLLGYREELDVFAAWDARSHPNPGNSSSLQVPLILLRAAAVEGIASQTRRVTGTIEVVVAFQPEAIGTYLEMLPKQPPPGAGPTEMSAWARAGSGEEAPIEELPADVERRELIHEVKVKARDQRFRTKVVKAYEGRCAFCGLDSGLIEAAHIRGVGEGGPDLIANGLGVCPTHHAAFDRGMLIVDEGYAIVVNEHRLKIRGASDKDVERFRQGLLSSLRLPGAETNMPSPERLTAHRERWLRQ